MKFFLPLVILTVIGSIWYVHSRGDQDIVSLQHTPKETDITAYNAVSVLYNRVEYIVHYTNISDAQIMLIPNFSQQKGASSIAEDNRCTAAINGGFYSELDTPLGLFRHDGNQIADEQKKTNLVKAFFYLDASGNPHIDWDYPDDAKTVLQSGPYYVSDEPVSTVHDKPARRMVMIESTSGDYYIAAITTRDLTTSGPYLSDIGAIVFSITEPFSPALILNLDGGAASYYLGSDGYELSELTHVGSIIYIQ